MNPVSRGLVSLTLLSALPALSQTAETSSEHVEVKASKQQKTIDLTKSSESGSRLGLNLAETPATVEIIDQDTIRQRGDSSFLEAVEGGTGMTAGNPPGAPTIFSTRGFNGDDVTILFNGFRITNPGMSANPGDTWNLAQVEILKGPSSVLHGLGAVGGAVNFVTKKPSRVQQSEALLSFGSFKKLRVGLGSGGPLSEKLLYRVDVSQQNSDTFVDDAPYSYQQASGALQYEVNDRLSLGLETEFLKDDVKSYFGTPLHNHRIDERFVGKNYNVSDNKTLIESNWTRLRADYALSLEWKLSNLLYRYEANRHWKNGEFYSYNETNDQVDVSDLIEIEHDQTLLGDQLILQSTSPRLGLDNNLLLGVDVSTNRFKHTNDSPYEGSYAMNPDKPEDITFDSVRVDQTLPKRRTLDKRAAFFLENRVKFSPHFQLVLGLRKDQSGIKSKHLNPNTDTDGKILQALEPEFSKKLEGNTGRIGLVSEIHAGLNAFAQYTNAQSSPTTLVTLAKRNADFKLEKAAEVEVGLKHAVSDALDYTFSVYQITKKDLITSDPGDPDRNLQIGEQSSQGAELAWAASLPASLSWQGNLSVLKARYEKFFDGPVSYKGKTPTNVPEKVANTWLTHTVDRFTTLLGLRYVGEQQGDLANSYQNDAYALVQAAVTYKLGDYEITARGRNLTDRRYVAWNAGGDMALIGDPRSYELALYSRF